MKHIRTHIALSITLLACLAGKAQPNPRITNYPFERSALNPGAAGNNGKGDASLLSRNQWMGYQDVDGASPQPSTVLMDACIPIKPISSGIGLTYQNRKEGFGDNNRFALAYAYHVAMKGGNLGIGLRGAIQTVQFSLDKARFEEASDKTIELLRANSDGFNAYGMDAGVYYSNDRLYAGISCDNLLTTDYSAQGNDLTNYVARTASLMAGYVYVFSNPKFKIKPSAIVRTSGTSYHQMTLSALAEYGIVYGGLAYSTGHDVSLHLGLQFNDGSALDGVRAGASYDIPTSKLSSYQQGSMEIMVGYSFRIGVERAVQSYKSVRFL